MILLVCGGRNYQDAFRLKGVLDRIHEETPILRLVQGGAAGADTLAAEWADKRGVPYVTYHAEWAAHGPWAGWLRNQRMLDMEKPDLVLAFPGGRGTADMVRRAKRAGVDVRIIHAKVPA